MEGERGRKGKAKGVLPRILSPSVRNAPPGQKLTEPRAAGRRRRTAELPFTLSFIVIVKCFLFPKVCTARRVQAGRPRAESRHHKDTTLVQLQEREAERGCSNRGAASLQAAAPATHRSATQQARYW